MDSQETVRRVKFFNNQLLQVQDFTDEQAYHIRMRRTHNRLMHSWGVLEGLELHLDPVGQNLTLEEGIALDAQGRELVLPSETRVNLSPYAGRTVWVTLAYREQSAAESTTPGASGFSRVEEVPELSLAASPPDDPSLRLVLGRLVVGADGAATALDDGEGPNQRRRADRAGGDMEGRALTLVREGMPVADWPRLHAPEAKTVRVEGSLQTTGALRVDGDAALGASLAVGPTGGGTPAARVHVVHAPQDSDGNALVLGPTGGSNLRLGYHQDYSWIQSHGSRPLRINELGNDVLLAPLGRSMVGIGTDRPLRPLHVAGDDALALLESRGSTAQLSLSTREGAENRVELAARPQGRLALWVAGGGDVVNLTRDGRLGIGTESPAQRFHVRSDDPVALFESIGEHAYLRLDTREGPGQRVEIANRPGGRLALSVAGAGDALNVTRDGRVGVGTAEPQGRLHVSGDLVVDGEIRSLRGGEDSARWSAVKSGLAFHGSVGVGTMDPQAKLQVIHTPQDSNGDALQLGPDEGSNLRLGYHQDYSWIQSHGSRPLRINEMGNDVVANLGGGSFGIGTASPQARLHVAGDVFVDGQIRTPQGVLTPGGGGGSAPSPWTAVNGGISYAGRVGIGAAEPQDTLDVGGPVRLLTGSNPLRLTSAWSGFTDGGPNQAEISNDTEGYKTLMLVGNKSGDGQTRRVSVWDRLEVNGSLLVTGDADIPAGRVRFGGGEGRQMLNLWNEAYGIGIQSMTQYARSDRNFAWYKGGAHAAGEMDPGGGSVMMVLSDGRLGVGTQHPQAPLHVAGDVFVEGTIRTAAGELVPGGGGGGGGGEGAPSPWVSAANGISYGAGAATRVGIGTVAPDAKLQVVNGAQDSNGDTLILGPTTGANLRLGYHQDYAWLQSHGAKPLRINELGNDVILALRGGRVGVGTEAPQMQLHVGTDLNVGPWAFPSGVEGRISATGKMAEISFTRRSLSSWPADPLAGDRYLWYNQDGIARFWTEKAGNLLAVGPNGNVAMGADPRDEKLYVRGDLFVEGKIRTPGGDILPGGGGGAPTGGVASFDRIDFGTRTRQMLNLWTEEYGIGIQANTQYYRTNGNFAWHRGGKHADGELDPGGGTVQMVLDPGGNLGIGTAKPQDRLDVAGGARLLTGSNPLRFTSAWSGFTDGGPNQAEISNDTGSFKTLMLVGNKSGDGKTRKVSVWDRLEVNGSLEVTGRLTPSAGNGEGAGILFPPDPAGGSGDRAWLRYYPRQGEAMTLEMGTSNDGDDHIALMPSGNVGVGTNNPGAKLHVIHPDQPLRVEGPGDLTRIVFTKEGGQSNWDIGVGGGRVPRNRDLWIGDFRKVHFVVSDGTGNVGIGKPDPTAKLHVVGDMVVEGRITATGGINPGGAKVGYVADQFVNATGEPLEEGDVVVIGDTQPTLFYGDRQNIAIPEVDPAERAHDRRVCGIVAQVHDFDESAPGMEPVSVARKKRTTGAAATEADDAADDGDPRRIGHGQRGLMVTLGSFAHCKVDADIAAIEVGDLLTTSPTRGHAQKVTDPAQAMGSIVAKALAPLKKGKGKIPVMVMLQ
jgi:hypothetical protein